MSTSDTKRNGKAAHAAPSETVANKLKEVAANAPDEADCVILIPCTPSTPPRVVPVPDGATGSAAGGMHEDDDFASLLRLDGETERVVSSSTALEALGTADDEAWFLWFDDEFRIKRKPLNVAATTLLRTQLAAGVNGSPHFVLGHAVLERRKRCPPPARGWWTTESCTLEQYAALLKAAEAHVASLKLTFHKPPPGDAKQLPHDGVNLDVLAGGIWQRIEMSAPTGVTDAIRKLEKKQAAGTAAACSRTGCTAGAYTRCERCKQARYCSRQCQKADWKAKHRAACTPAAAVAAAAAAPGAATSTAA